MWVRGWCVSTALKKTDRILTGKAGILGRKDQRSKGKEWHG